MPPPNIRNKHDRSQPSRKTLQRSSKKIKKTLTNGFNFIKNSGWGRVKNSSDITRKKKRNQLQTPARVLASPAGGDPGGKKPPHTVASSPPYKPKGNRSKPTKKNGSMPTKQIHSKLYAKPKFHTKQGILRDPSKNPLRIHHGELYLLTNPLRIPANKSNQQQQKQMRPTVASRYYTKLSPQFWKKVKPNATSSIFAQHPLLPPLPSDFNAHVKRSFVAPVLNKLGRSPAKHIGNGVPIPHVNNGTQTQQNNGQNTAKKKKKSKPKQISHVTISGKNISIGKKGFFAKLVEIFQKLFSRKKKNEGQQNNSQQQQSQQQNNNQQPQKQPQKVATPTP